MTNLKKYLTDAYYKTNRSLKLESILSVHDKMKNKSLSAFLKISLGQYDVGCELFYHYYRRLILDLKMMSFYGYSFILIL